ncbi:MAG: hypothetical protein P1V21_00720 [Rhizobiaceae bacterium]|nr:hypothetical protein [Rhizobiaceae bacterium]
MKKMIRRFGAPMLILATILIGAAIGNFGSAVGNQLTYWLEIPFADPQDQPAARGSSWYVSAIIWFVFSACLLWAVAAARKQLLSLRAELRRSGKGRARKAVIMGLSFAEKVTDAEGRFDEDADPLLGALARAGLDKASLPVADMAEMGLLQFGADGRLNRPASPGGHTWVQNLRALREHIILSDRLSVVVICPSRESALHAPEFKAFLERMLLDAGKDWVRIYINDFAPDYSEFEDVRNALEQARELCIEKGRTDMKLGISDEDICIDATSGTAAFSIAAAIVTLNHDLVYSYVTSFTNGDPRKGTLPSGGEMRIYDATVDIAAFIS